MSFNNKYSFVMVVLLIISFSAFTVCAGDQSAALNRLSKSYEFVKAGNMELALKECDKAMKLDPNMAIAYLTRGEFAVMNGNYEFAVKMFDKGFPLLKDDSKQPTKLSGIPATKAQILGDICPLYGLSLLKLAQANIGKNEAKEIKYLERSKSMLSTCKKYEPAPERLKMANELLKGFR